MATIAFDTLKYAQRMKSVGFTDEQANEQSSAIAEIIDENLATKHDIALVRREIELLRKELKQDIKELESRLIIRLGGMMFVAIIIVATLVKIL